MAQTLLRTESLTKRFGGVHALEAVTLDVAEKSLHALIGPNGAGKTTFFHVLTGVELPTSGRILFDGMDVTRLAAAERVKLGIARSYQRTNIFPGLSVRENLLLAATRAAGESWALLPKRPRRDVETRVEEVLATIGLTKSAGLEAQTLPYGAQRLLDIGIALCCRPKLLLMDEPTSGLSSAELHEAVDLLKTLSRSHTILLIEHNMEIVSGIADAISVLNFGRLIAQGSAEEIGADQTVQSAYFGSRRSTRAS